MILAGIDIETTGLKVENGDRITEIGLKLFNTDTKKYAQYVQRVNPEKNVSAKAQRITGLTWQLLKSEPTWKEVGLTVNKLLQRVDVLIGHNAIGFDFPFIAHHQNEIGISNPLPNTLIDTMVKGRVCTCDGKLPSLEELCWCLGIEYDQLKAHGALYDAELALECYMKQPELFTEPS